MDAVILAGGKGTRMGPLCADRPKALLKILNRPVLEWNLEAAYDFVDSYTIVIGHQAGKIKKFLGNSFKEKTVKYVEQKEQLGTGHALLQAQGRIKGKFFVMMGDDLYDRACFEKMSGRAAAILVQKSDNAQNFGLVEVSRGKMSGLIEKPKKKQTGLVNAGLYTVDERIFQELKTVKKSARGEIELTDAISGFSKGCPIDVVQSDDSWVPLTYPWSLFDATEKKIQRVKKFVDKTAVVEAGATIKGEVAVGPGSFIKNGVYIEGPVYIGANCKIGPNCYIRSGSVIGDNCHIGNAVEIKNSIFFGNTNAGHLSYIGDSIIGENCNFGAGAITANLRLDEAPVKVTIKNQRISTGRRKMGVIIGDDVKTGIHVSMMPGVCISSGSRIRAHEIVKRDV